MNTERIKNSSKVQVGFLGTILMFLGGLGSAYVNDRYGWQISTEVLVSVIGLIHAVIINAIGKEDAAEKGRTLNPEALSEIFALMEKDEAIKERERLEKESDNTDEKNS